MVDDASFNRNGEIVQAHRKEEPRIIFIRHQKNETFNEAPMISYSGVPSIGIILSGGFHSYTKDDRLQGSGIGKLKRAK